MELWAPSWVGAIRPAGSRDVNQPSPNPGLKISFQLDLYSTKSQQNSRLRVIKKEVEDLLLYERAVLLGFSVTSTPRSSTNNQPWPMSDVTMAPSISPGFPHWNTSKQLKIFHCGKYVLPPHLLKKSDLPAVMIHYWLVRYCNRQMVNVLTWQDFFFPFPKGFQGRQLKRLYGTNHLAHHVATVSHVYSDSGVIWEKNTLQREAPALVILLLQHDARTQNFLSETCVTREAIYSKWSFI